MGEYEPNDSRNVTGAGQSQDGRWTGQAQQGGNAQPAQTQGQEAMGHAAPGAGPGGGSNERDRGYGHAPSGFATEEEQIRASGGPEQAQQLGQQSASQAPTGTGANAQQQQMGSSRIGQQSMAADNSEHGHLSAGEAGGQVGQPSAGMQQHAPQQNMGGSQGMIGQDNDGVSDRSNQFNDHTSALSESQQ
jgi:hypothetical protein